MKVLAKPVAASTKPSLAFKGYCIGKGAVEFQITTDTAKIIRKSKNMPRSRSSRPIREMLAGERVWGATKELIARHYPLADGGTAPSNLSALIIRDLAAPREAYAVRVPVEGPVVAAVKLGATAGKWTAEACALKNDGLASLVAARFLSASVSALLKNSEEAFAPLLSDPTKALGRLEYLRSNGDAFVPIPPDKQKWTIACVWPDWQLRRLGFPARSLDLSIVGNLNTITDNYLRQICFHIGLTIKDTTDS